MGVLNRTSFFIEVYTTHGLVCNDFSLPTEFNLPRVEWNRKPLTKVPNELRRLIKIRLFSPYVCLFLPPSIKFVFYEYLIMFDGIRIIRIVKRMFG